MLGKGTGFGAHQGDPQEKKFRGDQGKCPPVRQGRRGEGRNWKGGTKHDQKRVGGVGRRLTQHGGKGNKAVGKQSASWEPRATLSVRASTGSHKKERWTERRKRADSHKGDCSKQMGFV